MASRDSVVMVAVTDEDDKGTENGEIAGYAFWTRYGSVEEVARWCPDSITKSSSPFS